VVANEVKELSRQTASAADEIRKRIEAMQSSANQSVASLKEIVGVIGEVNEISQIVVSAVKEQTATSGEIASNISQGSTAATEIARNVAETAQAITQVSSNIQDVSLETTGVADRISQAKNQAQQLTELSDNLKNIVSMFHIRSTFLEWSSDLSIGIVEIDDQHKILIKLINDLNDAVAGGKAKETVKAVLDGLAEYTVTHFGNEETYFKKFAYPEYEAHKGLHDRFVAKVNKAREDLQSGRAMVSRDIMIFLKEWLVEHIMKTDRRYAPYLRKRGVV